MRKSTTLAIAFAGLAGVIGSAAYADDQSGDSRRRGMMMRLDKAMKDQNGSLTFDQFSAAMDTRLKKIVADNGGKVTVAQLADALEKARFERMAKRILARYEAGDGALTTKAIEDREKKMFALMDRNNDGKIVKDEIPRRWKDRRGNADN
ncbi:hypothetical protein SAMN04488498_108146 [Mesorhizobium albiziae]|uniref:EF hand n=1 Tax=Neomesorhizobium albiziae TaxID=335020 RepID=A0A1I4ALA9_9HYPH|nr:hypothetical protein [Mesorhizobium albiziae]GLS32942.1 hypothetical protein GCM10007937_46520 [Mesorhizobium albiziae]SFK57292.1 hypothetical protein SAMN04488498_108146 [Mesorhizobium albiziae]